MQATSTMSSLIPSTIEVDHPRIQQALFNTFKEKVIATSIPFSVRQATYGITVEGCSKL